MTSNHLFDPQLDPQSLKRKPKGRQTALGTAGQAANKVGGSRLLDDYRQTKSVQTLRRHASDIKRFVKYLNALGEATQTRDETLGEALLTEASYLSDFAAALPDMDSPLDLFAWQGLTWGLVADYKQWLLREGYAVRTVNHSISTLRIYAEKATQAGAIEAKDLTMIRTIGGYKSSERRRVNQKRDVTRQDGAKKAEPVLLTTEQAHSLKHDHPDHPQGRRDQLLMCLLIDHGLRCSEVSLLNVETISLSAKTLHFYRPKVDLESTHILTDDSYEAARRYLNLDARDKGRLLRGSRRGGKLTDDQMSTRAINNRVRTLGKRIGVFKLSPHDCRHYAATHYAQQGKTVNQLMDIFGWSSPAMAVVYVERARVIKLD